MMSCTTGLEQIKAHMDRHPAFTFHYRTKKKRQDSKTLLKNRSKK